MAAGGRRDSLDAAVSQGDSKDAARGILERLRGNVAVPWIAEEGQRETLAVNCSIQHVEVVAPGVNGFASYPTA